MFPIRDIKGHVIGFGARALDDSLPKYLNSPQTPIFDKSSSLYGIDKAKEAIRRENVAIIMEGYMDVLTAHQHGWDNSVASMGTALTEKQLSSLKKLTKNLILALDADTAGEEATLRMAETIDIENYLRAEVRVVVPSQGKDPDEEIRKAPGLWAQSLEKAKPIVDFIIDTAKSKVDLGNAQDKVLAADKLMPIISKIDDPIRQGHYIQKLAQILNVKENDLRDRLAKLKIDQRKRKSRVVDSPVPAKDVSFSSTNPIEEYCLWLLLKYPRLRSDSMKLNKDYFEYSENREIFLKWQQSADINSLRDNLDSTLHQYFNSLLNKVFRPTIKDDEDEQRRILNDCITGLQERLLRKLEAKKGELFAIEAEMGGQEAQLAKVDELGIEGHKQLKHVFVEQSRRRHSAV
jgi:DNA primase